MTRDPAPAGKKRSTRACILTRLIPQNIDNNKKSTYSHSVSYPVSFAWLLQVIFAENSAFSHFHATSHRQKLCNLQRVTKIVSTNWHRPRTLSLHDTIIILSILSTFHHCTHKQRKPHFFISVTWFLEC